MEANKEEKDLEAMFEERRFELAKLVPKYLTVDRVIAAALAARSRNPLLLKCTMSSFYQSVRLASQLGLETGGLLGHAYLVPFQNNKAGGQYECQLIPGYRGLIELARRSGAVENIEAHIVYEKDEFSYQFGTAPALSHIPCRSGDGGAMTHVYSVISKVGKPIFEVMTKDEVDKIRRRSKAAESGPWVTDYNEMAKKTVIKRQLKYQQLSTELSQAIDIDNEATGYDLEIEAKQEAPQIEEPKRKSETAAKTPEPESNALLDKVLAEREKANAKS